MIKISNEENSSKIKEYIIEVDEKDPNDDFYHSRDIDISTYTEKSSYIIQQLVINIPNRSVDVDNIMIEVIDSDGNNIPTKVNYNFNKDRQK